jgi:glycosyltransferase involved in cell wall biosynthesis
MDENENSHLPKKEISVILAIRNEEGYIRKCLDSLLNQDLQPERYEIIVIDGMSTDRTREVLSLYHKKFPHIIRIVDNPGKTQAIGRNLGIQIAQGDTILIFSGHVYAHRQFMITLIKLLYDAPCDVAAVGGVHIPPADETLLGKVMADVQNSLIGGAGTYYRHGASDQCVDSVGFCVYKKKILIDVGLYDERFDIGEDVELNWRIKKKGFKLLLTHNAVAYYYRKHSSFKQLALKMISYGIWRALVTKKHPDSFKIVFCIPMMILISLVTLPILIVLKSPVATVVTAGLVIYIATILLSSIHLSVKRKNVKYFFLAVPIYIIEHLSIAAGLILGFTKKIPNK